MAKKVIIDNGMLKDNTDNLNSAIVNKVDKVNGKGLSTNDYTTEEKNKLAGIATGATANIGTITGIKMNGTSKGTSGVIDLGTVITAHQDISGKMNASLKGTANGVAELDGNGKVPSSQLPSFVDDVIEGYLYNGKFYKDSSHSKVITGEGSKIYIDLSTDKTYRWTGSAYGVISETIALGETSSTAYRGDRGKIAYDHSQATHARTDATKVEASSTNGNIKINGTESTVYTHPGSGTNPHGTTKSDVGLGNVGNFKAVSTVASQGLTDTEKSNARANIGAGTSSLTLGETSSTAYRGDRGKIAYDHSQTMHAPSNAQANVIETVKVNGTALTPSSKAVDIAVPSVGNGTVTIKQAGTSKGTFTMNQSGDTTIELTDNNTTYSSKSAASGGTDVSLVTTGEKYNWNNKANASHGTHVPSTCTAITDWNSATSTGWYMAIRASNAPTATEWYFGYVIAHTTNYVLQEVYQFTASTDAKAIPKYIRAKMNGTWGSWTDVTVQKKVPSNAVFTDTDVRNTAGSTDTSSKIFLVGATSQATNSQTYSDNQVYATNGQLDANSIRIAESVKLVYDASLKTLNFNFA